MTKKRGDLVVVDGLDGIGKGEIERALREFEEKRGKAVLDTISFTKAYNRLPEKNDFWDPPRVTYHVLMLGEPTYTWIGAALRDEATSSRNDRKYDSDFLLDLYARDGEMQMRRVSNPAREEGIDCIQSRCRAATLCFQSRQAELEGKDLEKVRERILSHPGTQYQLQSGIDLLIIPTIDKVERLQERLGNRLKNDGNRWEGFKFQESLKPHFESDWLREIFEEYGTKVAYLDAGKSPEETRQQALTIYRNFKETREVPEEFQKPNFN